MANRNSKLQPQPKAARSSSAKPARSKASQAAVVTNAVSGPEPDLEAALALVMELMAIPGRSGQERAIADAVVAKLKKAGVPQSAMRFDRPPPDSSVDGEIGSLVVQLPGTIAGPRRMLTAHLDTVPTCIGSKPTRNGDVVHSADPNTGLGADDRAGVAVVLTAALEILRQKLPHPPLTLCFFVQEEIGLFGARHLDTNLLGKPALAFNFDGGSPSKLTIGATGAFRMSIDVQGVASHAGGAPEQGVSAIAIAGIAVAEIHRDGWHGDVRKGAKRGTSNVGVIVGGEATNVVTNHVRLRAEARSHDPKFRAKIADEIERRFRAAVKEVRNVEGKRGSVAIERRMDYDSFKLDASSPCVTVARDVVASVGRDPQLSISNGGLDANWLFAHGVPTVTLGCGQMNQHMTSEMLHIKDFEDACRVGLRLAVGN